MPRPMLLSPWAADANALIPTNQERPALVVIHWMQANHPFMLRESRITAEPFDNRLHKIRLAGSQCLVVGAVNQIAVRRLQVEFLKRLIAFPNQAMGYVKIKLRGTGHH